MAADAGPLAADEIVESGYQTSPVSIAKIKQGIKRPTPEKKTGGQTNGSLLTALLYMVEDSSYHTGSTGRESKHS
jgi:hypothetical protein